ncbi:hypothetical protein [Comamonas kerstersii]|uniref:hypothetical protein n=1 Tax=Comamonas kerstersii TaxID=225992 RepID=UPI0026DA963C|nr:hypothetical protein [Comamonas kerstersii]
MHHLPGRLTLPRVSVLSPEFRYTSAAATNVAATIERERRLQAEELERQRRESHAAQHTLPGIPSPGRPVRLFAGLGHKVIELPSL